MSENREQLEKRPHSVVEGDVPSLYANSIGILMSLFDFQLIFGEIVRAETDGIVTRPILKVFVSPQHAKVLLDVLQKNVAAYEVEYGKIQTTAKSSSP